MNKAFIVFIIFLLESLTLANSRQEQNFCLNMTDAKKIAKHVLRGWGKKNDYEIMILNERENIILAKTNNPGARTVGSLIKVYFKKKNEKIRVSLELDKLKHGDWLWGNFSYEKFITSYKNMYEKWPNKRCSEGTSK